MEDKHWDHLKGERKPRNLAEALGVKESRPPGLPKQPDEEVRSHLRKYVAAGVVGVVTLGIAGAVFLGLQDEPAVEREKEPVKTEAVAVEVPWYSKDANLFPVSDLPSWQEERNGGFTVNASDLDSDIVKYAEKLWQNEKETGLRLAPEGSYTSDPGEALNADGTLNPLFAYWTADTFRNESAVQVAKLLNPVYGGWGQYQFAESDPANTFDVGSVGDTFSADFRRKVEEARGNAAKMRALVPLFADWDRNGYGMGSTLLNSGEVGHRWVGEVTGTPRTTWTYDAETLNYRVRAVYPVTYTAWTRDQERVEKTGELDVTFVADQAAMANPAALRVVVDSGTVRLR